MRVFLAPQIASNTICHLRWARHATPPRALRLKHNFAIRARRLNAANRVETQILPSKLNTNLRHLRRKKNSYFAQEKNTYASNVTLSRIWRLATLCTKHRRTKTSLLCRKSNTLATATASSAPTEALVQPFPKEPLYVCSSKLRPATSHDSAALPAQTFWKFAVSHASKNRLHIRPYNLYRQTVRYQILEHSKANLLLLFRYRDDFLSVLLYQPSLLVSAFCSSPELTIQHNVFRASSNAISMLYSTNCKQATGSSIPGCVLSREKRYGWQ